MRLILERVGDGQPSNDSDMVLLAWPIPGESVQRNIWFSMFLTYDTNIDVMISTIYGVEGYLIEVEEPDTSTSWDNLWDEHVPKVGTSISYDMADTLDTEPSMDPGQVSSDEILQIGEPGWERYFERMKILNFAQVQTGFIAGTPDTYRPTDWFKGHVSKKYRTRSESASMLGVVVPSMANMNAGSQLLAADPDGNVRMWARYKYIEHVVEEMMTFVLGLGNEGVSGAELPYDDAEDLIENLLTAISAGSNANWGDNGFRVQAYGKLEVEVPGRLPRMSLAANP